MIAVAQKPKLTGARSRLQRRILRAAPELARLATDWQPEPRGAISCRCDWAGAPRKVTVHRRRG